MPLNFCGSLFLRMGDFLYFKGTNLLRLKKKMVFHDDCFWEVLFN